MMVKKILSTGLLGLLLLGSTSVVSAMQSGDDASFVSQQVPGKVKPGKAFTARVTFRNTGTQAWRRSGGVKLGSQSPQDTGRWGLNRITLRNRDAILPGQSKTFEFRASAPMIAGLYTFQWQVLREGVHWFGESSPTLSIQVGSGGDATGGGSDGSGGGPTGSSGTPTPPGETPPQVASGTQFEDLVFAGYQGWFSAPGDRSFNRWSHWNEDLPPTAGRVTFDLYPDVRDYRPSDLFRSDLGTLGTGEPARLFASARPGVLDVHFRWMREYGIDGVALQRFVAPLGDKKYRQWRNGVTARLRQAAQAHGRYFYVMYDISGAPRNFIETIKWDWETQLRKKLGLPGSPFYARQDGKPVIGIWGFGFKDRPGTKEQAREIIRFFRNQGVYVVGVVPYDWRSSAGSSKPDWQDVYAEFDMVVPWSVGAYSSDDDLQSHYDNYILPDRDRARSLGVDYQRVIFPGFAWSNWNGGPRNEIPRRGGELLWRQAYFAKLAGVSVYIAMFDEYDEATAIAKAAENQQQTPGNQYFLTLDADGRSLSSDHYLWLSGQISRLIKGQIENSWNPPNR